jgi:hypothetical protein
MSRFPSPFEGGAGGSIIHGARKSLITPIFSAFPAILGRKKPI